MECTVEKAAQHFLPFKDIVILMTHKLEEAIKVSSSFC